MQCLYIYIIYGSIMSVNYKIFALNVVGGGRWHILYIYIYNTLYYSVYIVYIIHITYV